LLPATSPKILLWHADIVQKALIGIGIFAIGPRRPDDAWYRVDDLTKLVVAFEGSLASIINIDFISLVSGGTAAAHGWRSAALPRFRLLASRPFTGCFGVCAQCLHQSSDLHGPLVYDDKIKAGI
jgi:hypothetical protein